MNTYQNKWNDIKNEVMRTWTNIKSEDLENAKESSKKLLETVQQKLGSAQTDVKSKIDNILKKFDVSNETKQ